MKLHADKEGAVRHFTAKLSWKERFDPREIEMLTAGVVPMLIPPEAIQGKKNDIIQFNITPYTTLEFYLSCILNREQFSELLLNCIDLFRQMQKVYLNYKNLVLDFGRIYVQLFDRTLHFIYLPLADSRREASIPDFFRQLLQKANRSTNEQVIFLDQLLGWLARPVPFALDEFEVFIRGGRSVAPAYQPPAAQPAPVVHPVLQGTPNRIYNPAAQQAVRAPSSPVNPAVPASAAPVRPPVAPPVISPVAPVSPVRPVTPVAPPAASVVPRPVTPPATPPVVPAPAPAPVQSQPSAAAPAPVIPPAAPAAPVAPLPVAPAGSGGGTVILAAVPAAPPVTPAPPAPPAPRYFLKRINTDEKIEISASPFLMGADPASVKYVVTNNPAISRRHAELAVRDGACWITDQHSTNKTYLNDAMLEPLKPQKLTDGDSLRLANEEFIFIQEG